MSLDFYKEFLNDISDKIRKRKRHIFNSEFCARIAQKIFDNNNVEYVLKMPSTGYFEFEKGGLFIQVEFDKGEWDAIATYPNDEHDDFIETDFEKYDFNEMLETKREEIKAERDAIRDTESYINTAINYW